jgi:hypothetical protein
LNPTDEHTLHAPLSAETRRRGRPPNIPRPQGISPNTPAEAVREAIAPQTQQPVQRASTVALEDPRSRAARRAFELREHLGNFDQGVDEYKIDLRVIPDGWSYEWKAESVLGQEQTSYMVGLAQRGWEAVAAARHPDMMPKGYDPKGPIKKKGQILMERPLEITKEVEEIEKRKARAQVNQKEAQLNNAPTGQFSRDNKGTPLASVKREYGYEPIAIPK